MSSRGVAATVFLAASIAAPAAQASSARQLHATARDRAALRFAFAHDQLSKRPSQVPPAERVLVVRYGGRSYALARFAGFRDQPELILRAPGQRWTDFGPAIGIICRQPKPVQQAFHTRVRCVPPPKAHPAPQPRQPATTPTTASAPTPAPSPPSSSSPGGSSGRNSPPPTVSGVDLVVEPFSAHSNGQSCVFQGAVANHGTQASQPHSADRSGLQLQVQAQLNYDLFLALPSIPAGGSYSYSATVPGHDCSGYWLFVEADYGPWNSEDADLSDNQRALPAHP